MRGVTATLAAEVISKLEVWLLGIAASNAQVAILVNGQQVRISRTHRDATLRTPA